MSSVRIYPTDRARVLIAGRRRVDLARLIRNRYGGPPRISRCREPGSVGNEAASTECRGGRGQGSPPSPERARAGELRSVSTQEGALPPRWTPPRLRTLEQATDLPMSFPHSSAWPQDFSILHSLYAGLPNTKSSARRWVARRAAAQRFCSDHIVRSFRGRDLGWEDERAAVVRNCFCSQFFSKPSSAASAVFTSMIVLCFPSAGPRLRQSR